MKAHVIIVNNLGKRFRVSEVRPIYRMRYLLSQIIRAPYRIFWKRFSSNGTSKTNKKQFVWALRNVSFEIKKGEVVGLIGHNGAGKSVLLKILSRVTKPTEGFAEIHGSVASLLEVDTGFHRDFTGLENIYMTGAILGMKRSYIKQQLPKIIEISGLKDFIDTPVKWYSSGMRVKLAFAIAAQLKPEILILDEILAVADKGFRERSKQTLEGMSNRGQTILLVSHNMELIEKLCDRILVLDKGTLIQDTSAKTFFSKEFTPQSV